MAPKSRARRRSKGPKSLLRDGNTALRNGEYAAALDFYRKIETTELENSLRHIIDFNTYLAGRRSGITTLGEEFNVRSQDVALSSEYDIVLNCWLRNPEPIQDAVVRLHHELRGRGFNVLMATHSKPLLQDPTVDSFEVDFSLMNAKPYGEILETSMPAWLENELLAIIVARFKHLGRDDLIKRSHEFRPRIRKAYGYWRNMLDRNNPGLVAVWGTTAAISRLQVALCRELNIPYVVLERGHFENSLTADVGGQRAYRASNLTPNFSSYDVDFYRRIETWIKNNSEPPYAKHNADTSVLHAIQQKRNQGYSQVVTFIGSNDNGSGVAYDSPHITERHAKWIFSSGEAAQQVVAAIEQLSENTLLVLKPHPIDRFDYSQFSGENVILADSSNINQIIAASDVCVTTSTTAIAQCVIYQVPVVSVALSDFSTRDIMYECESHADLTRKIRSALEHHDFDRKVQAGRDYLCELFSTGLFLAEQNSEFLSVGDLAEVMGRRVTSFLRRGESPRRVTARKLKPCRYRRMNSETFAAVPSVHRRALSVVIPVYGGLNETRACIERACVQVGESPNRRLIIINDASPDPSMLPMLQEYEKFPFVSVESNDSNVGFIGTVNRGIEIAGDDDVIILNSDALLGDSSLSYLTRAAYAEPRIATATPFSNNASIYSIPFPPRQKSLSIDESLVEVDVMSLAVAQLPPEVVETPVGHGFCMYIRRSAINAIGGFDEVAFDRGYSEEVDFCLRGRAFGFYNVLAAQAYVGHIGGVSFAEESDVRRFENQQVIRERFPEYFSEIKNFLRNDPLKYLRESAELHRAAELEAEEHVVSFSQESGLKLLK